MIKRPGDYDQTASFGEGYKSLKAGGYVCRIIQAEEAQDKNGNPMIHIAFDVIDGEFANHFMALYRARKDRAEDPTTVKYPFEGQAWIPVYDYEDKNKTSKKFKGFCTAVEESGTQVWSQRGDFLTGNLKNAQVGVVYQNQEQEYNGKTYWRAVPWGFRSVDVIDSGDYFVPKDKALPEKTNSYGSYGFNQQPSQPSPFGQATEPQFTQMMQSEDVSSFGQAEDNLPF